MKADEMLDYLINAMTDLINGKDIDLVEFQSVCNDVEARGELKEAMKDE